MPPDLPIGPKFSVGDLLLHLGLRVVLYKVFEGVSNTCTVANWNVSEMSDCELSCCLPERGQATHFWTP